MIPVVAQNVSVLKAIDLPNCQLIVADLNVDGPLAPRCRRRTVRKKKTAWRNEVPHVVLIAQRVRTAVAAGRDAKQAVHGCQLTKSWSVAPRSRRFGMDAEHCGCALLAATNQLEI